MADGSTYPFRVTDDNQETRLDGNLIFSDSTNQPAPSSNSIVSGTALAISGLAGSVVASRYVGQTASGSPASGAHLVGDFSTSTIGEVFVCSVAGTPGTWIQVVAGTLAASALTNAMVSASAAIAYSKLALTGSIVNADVGAAAAIAASKLAAGLAGQVLQGTGPTYAYPPGFEISYDQITSGVNVASTTEGTPTSIIAGTSHTYEAVPYVAEFFSPQVTDSSAAAGTVTILFIADGASIGRIAVSDSVTATTQIVQALTGRLRFTPTAAAHTYGISAFCSNTGGTPAVGAGAGGINTLAPRVSAYQQGVALAQLYRFTDANGETRLLVEISPDPAFNGGTITAPLVVSAAVASGATVNILDLKDSNAADYEIWAQAIDDGAGNVSAAFNIAPHGGGAASLALSDDNLDASFALTTAGGLTLTPRSTLNAHAPVVTVGIPGSGNVIVFKDGHLVLTVHTAPDDTDLGAGQCALWFDQTNGAAKLMVKAKQADGTVRTGSLALT